jgi:flagellar export protein FliJ
MKAFRFTLEAVRTLRQRQENDAMESYVAALASRQQMKSNLEAIDARIKEDSSHILRLLDSGCRAAQASQARHFHSSLEKQLNECVIALGRAERRVQAASQAMLVARQQREIVDTYRDKQHQSHERLRAREEQKTLDEFSVRRVNATLTGQTQSSYD